MIPQKRKHPLDAAPLGKGMTDTDFSRLSRLVYSTCGIRLAPVKKTMLEGRLRKRLKTLGIDSFRGYCEYLATEEGMRAECIPMLDAVTTNKTDFFREPKHFEFLLKVALPELERLGAVGKRAARVWSAGCSSGEEPYTLAMVLSEYGREHPGFRFTVLGTDISTRVLESARKATYRDELVDPVDIELRKRYLLKSKDKKLHLVRMGPEIRSAVTFRRLNFMDSDYGIGKPMHMIFCRNVLIYFDRETQEEVIRKFYRCLAPGGYLFVGHSETVQNMDLPLVPAAASVYRKAP